MLGGETNRVPRFMLTCASYNSGSRHLDIVDNVLKLGYDFDNTPAPQFELWPKPCPDDQGGETSISIIPPDPFFVEYLKAITRTNQGRNLIQCANDVF